VCVEYRMEPDRITVSKETDYSVKRDLLQSQKRPITVSKETCYSVKRELLQCARVSVCLYCSSVFVYLQVTFDRAGLFFRSLLALSWSICRSLLTLWHT
jgi:hypothetical protein